MSKPIVGYLAPKGIHGKFYCVECFEKKFKDNDAPSRELILEDDPNYRCGAKCYECEKALVRQRSPRM